MKNTTQDAIYQWLVLIIYCCLIYFQSSYPSLSIIPNVKHIDKVLHFFAYMLLGVLFYRAFKTLLFQNNDAAILVSILSAALFALSDELHQLYVPKRSADYLDFLADLAGILHGVFLYSTAVKHQFFNPVFNGLTKLRTLSRNVLF